MTESALVVVGLALRGLGEFLLQAARSKEPITAQRLAEAAARADAADANWEATNAEAKAKSGGGDAE